MRLSTPLKEAYVNLRAWRHNAVKNKQIKTYIRNGREPWSVGYEFYKKDFIKRVINDTFVLEKFRDNLKLPEKYGDFLDERVVEYPWFLSRLSQNCDYPGRAYSFFGFKQEIK